LIPPLDQKTNAVFLWHGTSAELADRITSGGFNEQYAKVTGLFGPGVYFADMCSKSDQYTVPSSASEYTLLLCRVSLGFALGINTPQVDAKKMTSGYDSLIGRSSTGSSYYMEYVVYDGRSAFPQFVVVYERVLR